MLSLATRSSVLVAGDFNVYYPVLQSVSPVNPAGRHLAAVLDELLDDYLIMVSPPTSGVAD